MGLPRHARRPLPLRLGAPRAGARRPGDARRGDDDAVSGSRGRPAGVRADGSNDWGLGFELRDGKRPHWTGERNSPRTFGHFGAAGTFLWVDPGVGLALACLTDLEFGDWAKDAWPRLSDSVLEELE